jgi:uncharacterized protein YjiS (DUF1127 family)
MAYSLPGERPAVAAVTLNPLRVFARWVAKARAARAQRIALGTLLEFDSHRLADLGINRGDLFDALHHSAASAGHELSVRRAQNSSVWPRS